MKNWKWVLLGAAMVWPISGLTQTSSPAEAQALEGRGNLAEAADAWRAVTRQNPKDAAAFASLGVVLSKEQKYNEAASAYRRALALNPKLPGIQLNLGLAEFKQGRFQAAIAPFRAALSADPGNRQALLLLGFSYYGAKDFAEAATQLAPVAKADPDNVELHHVLAQSCLWAKEYSCALDEFRQILQRDPDSATAHVLMGEALDGVRRTSDAIAEFQTAASIAPREPNIHFGLGYLFWKLHKLDEARREFENELAVDPGNAQALAYLADVEIKNNHTDAALPLLRKATALKDDLRIAYLDLGGVLAQEKKYPEAVIAFQHAVNLDPKEPDAHYRLGRVYQAMGKTDESKKEFAMVRELRAKTDEGLVQKMSPAPPSLDQSQVMRPD